MYNRNYHMNIVIKEDIKKGLRNLGINTGFHLGVHSSLQSFGKVKGGAITVINALLKAVGILWMYQILPFNPKENET